MRIAVVVLVLLARTAHADLAEQLFQRTNAGRHELGLGFSHEAYELHAGHHVTDRWTVLARARIGERAIGELDLSYVLARGQVVLPTDHVLRVDLALAAGGPDPFASVALRVQPRTMNALSVELGARHGDADEITLRIAFLFPFDQNECWVP
ncbi:MAG TPA: hypothetical protein VIU61_10510 [Kofleriaceae bacterium]